MVAVHVDLALIHYPVYNKNQEVIGSAVTNLDIHDIARAGRTYGVENYYIVTPYPDQQKLTKEIVDHWQFGYGAEYNQDRREALSRVQICSDLAALYDLVAVDGNRPLVLATSAREYEETWSFQQVREKISSGERLLLLFGTAWGLAREVIDDIDGMLPPISGVGDYNHLSVRTAAAIVLDRLLAERSDD